MGSKVVAIEKRYKLQFHANEVPFSFTTNVLFMIIVHEIFNCKPGNASKVAKLFKEWCDAVPKKNQYVMTDVTGQFHRVIFVSSFESMSAYEEEMKTMGQSDAEKKLMEKFKDLNEMYVSGSREIFKVW